MNGKQLKNSILQWAIQGKLVPQDPNDEPASVLLERIRAEKTKLIKEKKIKKDKNESIIYRGEDNSYYEKFLATGEVKCIDEEIPFEIPVTWEWVRLTYITYLIEDCPHSTAKDEGKGYPLVRTPNIGFGRLSLNCVHRVSETVYNQRNVRAVPQTSDLIFAREAPAGNIAVIQEGEQVCLGQRTVLIRPFTQYILSDYLAYYILAPSSQQNLVNKSSGTTVPHVNLSDFRRYLIALPPIKEQRNIIDKISMVLPWIEKYGVFSNELQNLNIGINDLLKKSILQEAIQGKLVSQITKEGTAQELLEQIRQEKQKLVREGKLKKSVLTDSVIFKGDDNKYYEQIGGKCLDITEQVPFEIPENWVWTRLSYIASIYTGNSISETEKKLKFTDVIGRYYIGTKDVDFNNRVIYDNGIAIPKQYEQDFKIASSNSILMCIEGGSAGRKIAILNQDVCFGNKLCCFSPFVGIGKFIYYYLQSPSFFEAFNLNKTGIIGGVSIVKIKEILIPLPPIKEQQRIVAQIEKLFEQL